MKTCTALGDRSFSAATAHLMLVTAAFAIVFGFAESIAEAHGGGPGLTGESCVQQAGADGFVHLVVYQPAFNPFAEYCSVLPKPGATLLVFDLIGAELPDAPVSFEVDGRRLQMSVPARRYRSGIAGLRADLAPGKYTVSVRIDTPGGRRRISFALVVGAWWMTLLTPMIIIMLIGGAGAGYCIFQFRQLSSERGYSATSGRVELRSVGRTP